ncbi:MAG: hypothetical protein AMXMBFR84_24930 [Candidatus Hydrogenedentota bacterium]
MKCFYHETHDAVGVCKACGKGICKECAIDLDRGLACKDGCEDFVQELIQMNEQNVRMRNAYAVTMETYVTNHYLRAFFSMAFGGLIIAAGFLDHRVALFTTLTGFFFMFLGLYLVRRAAKFRIKPPEPR